MKRRLFILSAALLTVSLAATPLVALADEALSGTLVCAKCALKKADAHECQDVLIVADARRARRPSTRPPRTRSRKNRRGVHARNQGDGHRQRVRKGRPQVDHAVEDRKALTLTSEP